MGIIIKPIVTEKQTAITEKFANRYGFRVSPDANKLEIKKAVEELYNVTVVDVNTINYSGTQKTRYTKSGIINGKQAAFKKAIITLKEGERLFLYDGYDDKREYTPVQVVLEDGSLYNGLILTSNIKPDGISSLLIVGITIIAASVTIILSLIFIKKSKDKKKKQKN